MGRERIRVMNPRQRASRYECPVLCAVFYRWGRNHPREWPRRKWAQLLGFGDGVRLSRTFVLVQLLQVSCLLPGGLEVDVVSSAPSRQQPLLLCIIGPTSQRTIPEPPHDGSFRQSKSLE